MQAELTQLRDAIATEKRERLKTLEAVDGRVQSLVRRFRETASLTASVVGLVQRLVSRW